MDKTTIGDVTFFAAIVPYDVHGRRIENTGLVTDGYHTFNDLYEHRHALFCTIAQLANWGDGDRKLKGFKSWKHSDGSSLGGDWFIAGLELPEIGQVAYHFPAEYWPMVHLPHHDRAPEWDGHQPEDVPDRLLNWVEQRGHR
jgi:hypothetical protein